MKLKKSVILLLAFLCIGGFCCYVYFHFFAPSNKLNNKKGIDSIESYGYTLNDRHTDVYKNYFKELKSLLEDDIVNEEQYLNLIAKMFIMDLYSLDLRVDNNDIGGVEFVYEGARDNFKAKVQDTLYLYMESDLYGKREQDLPVVKDVTVSDVSTVAYYYNDNKDKDDAAYIVDVQWEYVDSSNYQKSATLYFIHDGNKLALVEIK